MLFYPEIYLEGKSRGFRRILIYGVEAEPSHAHFSPAKRATVVISLAVPVIVLLASPHTTSTTTAYCF